MSSVCVALRQDATHGFLLLMLFDCSRVLPLGGVSVWRRENKEDKGFVHSKVDLTVINEEYSTITGFTHLPARLKGGENEIDQTLYLEEESSQVVAPY